MIAPDRPEDPEAARLAELRRLHVLDSEAQSDLTLVVEAAAALFDVPVAAVSLVDEGRQFFTVVCGTSMTETTRDTAFCANTIATPDRVLIVPDAREDPRFAHNPLVLGEPGIRFYAGAALISQNGFALGSLCVIDHRPRTVTIEQIDALGKLSALAMHLLEKLSERRRAALVLPADEPCSAVFEWNSNARITAWSDAAFTLLGWSSADVIGSMPPFVLEPDRADFFADCRDVLAQRGDTFRVWTVQSAAGRFIEVFLHSTRTTDATGVARGVSTLELIGGRAATESRLAMLESVVVNSTDAVVVTNASRSELARNRIVYVNAAFTRMTGYSAAEAVGNTPQMLQGHKTDRAELERISAALRRGEVVGAEVVNYRRDGSEFWVEFTISPVTDRTGRCMYFIAVQRETTSQRALAGYERDRSLVLEMAVRNEPLATQLARIVLLLKGVIAGSLGTVLLVDGQRLIAAAADPALPQSYIAAIDGALYGPETGSCGSAVFTREAAISTDIATDHRWIDYRDAALSVGLRACWSMPLFAADGAVVGAFALYMNRPAEPSDHERRLLEETARFAALVIERHRDRERLERLALYDALTDLPSRKLIEDLLAAAIDRARTSHGVVALGILDLDRFKAINDAFGHHVGDELLRCIAKRLANSLRDSDSIGRLPGDQFIVIFSDLADPGDGIEAASRLISQFDTAFAPAGYEIFVRPSFGLAYFPQTSPDVASLFGAADRAMYAAKLRGGGIEIATAPIAGSAARLLDLEKDLQYAITRDEFRLHYQMMYDLRDGSPVGAEALIRWHHPQLGTIGPVDFIPLAEANGTIVRIGAWVIDEAARIARRWQDEGHDAFVTVNVSALQFDAPGLVAGVVDVLDRYALEPHRLHLELTESLIMRNANASAATLLQLKALGVRIVIDDFGTGYSSLAYLQRFAFDALKIDRAFVRGIGDDATSLRSEHIVAAVVALSHALGVTTIAEGVETAEQYAFVRSCGCNVVQGFLCAKPVPEELLVWQNAPVPVTMPIARRTRPNR